MNDLIISIYLYFARFPKYESLAKTFNKGTSSQAGYAGFKTSVDELEVKNLIPEIEDFVFGVDEKRIRKRIDNIGGYFLMVDYGSIQSIIDNSVGNTRNYFNIALTVAHPIKSDSMDDADEILISTTCLNYLKQIKDRIKLDDRDKLLKNLHSNYDAVPFVAEELNNSIGWTLTLLHEGVLL